MVKGSNPSLSAAIIDIDDNENEKIAARVRKVLTTTHDDRNQDIAKLRLMMILVLAIVIGMLMTMIASDLFPFFLDYFAIPFSLVLMGLWIFLFIATTTGILTKRYLLRLFVLMGLFVSLSTWSRFLSWYVFAVLALVIVVLEVLVSSWTLQTTPPAENDLQKHFFGTLKVICIIATFLSAIFIFFSVKAWPSASSLNSAVAALFCYAYASFSASKISGARSNCNDPMIVYSADAIPGYIDNPRWWYKTSIPVVGNACAAIGFVCLWPPHFFSPYTWPVGGALIPAFFGIQAYVHQSRLLTAHRFHILSDASILVETMCKSYAYGKAVCAILQPADAELPKQTVMCHIYCARMNVQTVVIELAGGQVLCLAPESPEDFYDAVSRTIDGSRAL